MIKNCIDPDYCTKYQTTVCGLDEAGRGPLVGSVVAAAAFIPQTVPIEILNSINDSKKITEKKREILAEILKANIIYGIGEASAAEIDKLNILQASMLAMQRAYDNLCKNFPKTKIGLALIDGNKVPKLSIPTISIIKGDQKSTAIAAASILAKTYRDAQLKALAIEYPQYGWEQNKGYPTASHLEALSQHGPTIYHRTSFGPVKKHLSLLERAS